MIEENLVQYGCLGLWTASLLYDKYSMYPKIIKAFNELKQVIKEKRQPI